MVPDSLLLVFSVMLPELSFCVDVVFQSFHITSLRNGMRSALRLHVYQCPVFAHLTTKCNMMLEVGC